MTLLLKKPIGPQPTPYGADRIGERGANFGGPRDRRRRGATQRRPLGGGQFFLKAFHLP